MLLGRKKIALVVILHLELFNEEFHSLCLSSYAFQPEPQVNIAMSLNAQVSLKSLTGFRNPEIDHFSNFMLSPTIFCSTTNQAS